MSWFQLTLIVNYKGPIGRFAKTSTRSEMVYFAATSILALNDLRPGPHSIT